MSKKISLVFILIVLVIMMLVPTNKVFAKEIESLDVTGGKGKIAVSGKTENGMLAVAISVYNEDETKLITTETTSVDNSNKYSYTLEIAEGNYVVKTADYDGGAYVSKKVTVEEPEVSADEDTTTATEETKTEETAKNSNPKTGDIIATFIAMFAVSTVGFIVTKRIKKRV